MSEYTLVVSTDNAHNDAFLDAVVESLPEVVGWHRSGYVPKGQVYLVAESRIQQAMDDVLNLYPEDGPR